MKMRDRRACSRAQISMEYLLIMGFALLITFPIVISFFANATNTAEQVGYSQARQTARKIVDAAESVYYLGKPSSTTLRVYIPERTSAVVITGRELTFRMRTTAGYSDIVVLSAVNLTGSVQPDSGLRYIKVEATGDSVAISS